MKFAGKIELSAGIVTAVVAVISSAFFVNLSNSSDENYQQAVLPRRSPNSTGHPLDSLTVAC